MIRDDMTRDELVNAINRLTVRRCGRGETWYFRRVYLRVCNGTWLKLSRDLALEYLAAHCRTEVTYTVRDDHETNIGQVLYVSPNGTYSQE